MTEVLTWLMVAGAWVFIGYLSWAMQRLIGRVRALEGKTNPEPVVVWRRVNDLNCRCAPLPGADDD